MILLPKSIALSPAEFLLPLEPLCIIIANNSALLKLSTPSNFNLSLGLWSGEISFILNVTTSFAIRFLFQRGLEFVRISPLYISHANVQCPVVYFYIENN